MCLSGGRWVLSCMSYCYCWNCSPDTRSWLPCARSYRPWYFGHSRVSISVEQLFSSSKHTLSDARSAMTAESASQAVIAKEWLKKGLRIGINYLDNVRVSLNYDYIMYCTQCIDMHWGEYINYEIIIKWEHGHYQDSWFLSWGLLKPFLCNDSLWCRFCCHSRTCIWQSMFATWKSCSTEILTPGMAKISWAIWASTGSQLRVSGEQFSAVTIRHTR